ncbi:MAG: L-aspartate oxidase [Planctomycetes bacterium]|nr:L-aspartate oxidase [Planctomycetota bacterium]
MSDHHRLDLDGRLLSVDSRRVPHYRFDLLIVGGGAGGASAALAAAEAGAEVALLVKGDREETNTLHAQGGVAAVLDRADSFAEHIADTMEVGCGLAEREVVEFVVRAGPAAIDRLDRLGARFDRRGDGTIELSREGGHTRPRVVHARGDATGREIQGTLNTALRHHPRITTFTETFVVDLLCAGDGAVVGVLALRPGGESAVFSARSTVLATGGAGQLYRETTNPAIATGDGIAIAFRAGASVRDLEFFQFHPTLLYIAGAARVLISEVVRGAGGILRDRDGVRFMPSFHEKAELAPRDVVSRAVFRRMVETKDTNTYLDLSEVEKDPHVLFPGISRVCRFFGIDIARDPVPVRPGAHYMVGGLAVDIDGRTDVDGLWAVGECASSGLHGANRMGSNSLLEGLVLGHRAGLSAAEEARLHGRELREWIVRPPRERSAPPAGVNVNVQDVTYSLKSVLWRQLGIERKRADMEDALSRIRLWTRAVSELARPEPRTFELLNMLSVAHLSAVSALHRTESRGVHYRTDFPERSPEPVTHTLLRPCFEDARIQRVEVKSIQVASGAVPLRS